MMTKATFFLRSTRQELLILLKNYYKKLVVVHCSRAPKKFEDTGLLQFLTFKKHFEPPY